MKRTPPTKQPDDIIERQYQQDDGSDLSAHLSQHLRGLAKEAATTDFDLLGIRAAPAAARPNPPVILGITADTDSGALGDGITNHTLPVLRGTAAPGALVTLSYNAGNGTTLVTGFAAADGTWEIEVDSDLPNSGNSGIRFTATQTVGSSTSTRSTAFTLKVDTVAPNAPGAPDLQAASDSGSSNSDNLTNAASPVFSGNAEASAIIKLYDENDNLIGQTIANKGGNWQIGVGTLAEGEHALYAVAFDAAGNESVSASQPLNLTIDRQTATTLMDLTAASDSGSDNSDNITRINTPLLTGQAEKNATVVVYLDGVAQSPLQADASGAFAFQVATPLGDGNHSFAYRYTDLAGNVSTKSGDFTVQIDTTLPSPVSSAPDLDASADSGRSNSDNITSNNTPSFGGSAPQGVIVELYASSTNQPTQLLGTALADAQGQWHLTSNQTLLDGSYNITTRIIDAAGNRSPDSPPLYLTIDRTAPAAPLTFALANGSDSGSNPSDGITNLLRPSLVGTGTAYTLITVYDNNQAIGSAVVAANGTWQIDLTQDLSPGTHSLTARASDQAGNDSTGLDLVITIDNSAPANLGTPDLDSASDSGSSAFDNLTNASTLNFGGTVEANAEVEVYLDGQLQGHAVADNQGHWQIANLAASDGVHTLATRVTDQAGNSSALSANPLTFTVDRIGPAAPDQLDMAASSDTGTTGDRTGNSATPVITGHSEALAAITLFDGNRLIGSGTADQNGVFQIQTASLVDGSHSISVRAQDVAGNLGNAYGNLVIGIDTTAPNAPSAPQLLAIDDTGQLGDDITANPTPHVQGSAEANAKVSIGIYNPQNQLLGQFETVADANGHWQAQVGSTLAEGSYQLRAQAIDSAGNPSPLSDALNLRIDHSGPATTLTADVNSVEPGGQVHYQISFAEPVAHLDASDFTIAGGQIGQISANNANGDSYTVVVTAGNQAQNLVLAFKANTDVTDQAGNSALAATALPVAVNLDTTAPTATLIPDSSDVNQGDIFSYDLTFSETVQGLDASDFAIVGGQIIGISSIGSTGDHYSIDVQADNNAQSISLALLANTNVHDRAGNIAQPVSADNVTVHDITRPSASFTPDGNTVEPGAAISYRLQFSEAVQNLDSSDFVVQGGSISAVTPVGNSGSEYTVTVRVANTATSVNLALPGNTNVVDNSGNRALAANAPQVQVVDTAPSLTLTPAAGTVLQGQSLTYSAQFSENVVNLDASDFTVSGGQITAISGSGNRYTVTVSANNNASTLDLALRANTDVKDATGHSALAASAAQVTVQAPANPVTLTLRLDPASDTGPIHNDGYTNLARPTLIGTTLPGKTVHLFSSNPADNFDLTVTADAQGNFRATPATALAFGAHTLRAEVGGSNNVPVQASVDVFIDNQSPNATLVANSIGVQTNQNTSFTLSFTEAVENLDATDFIISGGTISGIDSLGVDPQGRDNYTIKVTAGAAAGDLALRLNTGTDVIDLAGNRSGGSGTATISVINPPDNHTTPPTISFDRDYDTGKSNTDNITKLDVLRFTGHAQANTEVRLYDNNATLVGKGVSDGNGNFAISTGHLSEGGHNIYAQISAANGDGVANSPTVAITTDYTLPFATLTDLSSSTSGTQTALIGVSELLTYHWNINGTPSIAGYEIGLVNRIPFENVPNGHYNVFLELTDVAGNTNTSNTLQVDVAVPAPTISAPDLDAASDTGHDQTDNYTSQNTLSVSGTSTPGVTVHLYDVTTLIGSTRANANGNWHITTTQLSEGTHNLVAQAVANAGNYTNSATALTVTIDNTAPTAILNVPGLITSWARANTYSVNPSEPLYFNLNVDGRTDPAAHPVFINTSTGGFPIGQVANGTYQSFVELEDRAGNIGRSDTVTTTVNVPPPQITAPFLTINSDTGSSRSDGITSNAAPTFSGGSTPGVRVTLIDSVAGVIGSTVTDGTGNWQISSTKVLGDGVHQIYARATDAATNTANSGPTSITIDTVAPSVSYSAPTSTNGIDVVLQVQTEANLSGSLIAAGFGVFDTFTTNGNGDWSKNYSGLTAGSYTVQAIATDVAGNTGYSASITTVVSNGQLNAGIEVASSIVSLGNGNPASAADVVLVAGADPALLTQPAATLIGQPPALHG